MRKPQPFLFLFILLAAQYCNAQRWQALNPPLNIFNGNILATALDASGNIYAAGDFKNSGYKNFVAKWNGTSWSELGNGATALNANASILTLASNGNTIYAAGAFVNSYSETYVAKWDGSTWTELDNDTSLHANGLIYSIAADKAGNVYAAGGFTNKAGNEYVAKWNGTSWSELGSGANALNANNAIFSITVDDAGNVYAGGYFTNASGKQYVAKWNGTSWSELGNGAAALNANDFIRCLAADNAGNVYAAGNFRNSNENYYLAKWNGVIWSETGTGANALNANNAIATIAAKSSTEIYAAGYFTDGSGNHYIAKWDGTNWLQVNNPQSPFIAYDDVYSIQVDVNDNIYAGGNFTNKAGHQFIAKWNGNSWNEPGSKGDPFYFNSGEIYEIEGDTANNVYVSGYVYNNGESHLIEHWDGKGWSLLSTTPGLGVFVDGNPFTESNNMAIDKAGNLYVTGRHQTNIDSGYDCVLKWDGKKWSVLEDFTNALNTYNDNAVYNSITDIETDEQGNVYAVGNFNPSAIHNLAKWDGKKWSYVSQPNGTIQKLCIGNNGNLYALGSFYNQGDIYAVGEMTSNGVWQEVRNRNSTYKPPINTYFLSMAIDGKNNLYINGDFTDSAGNRYLQKWDGNTWSKFGVTNALSYGLATNENNIYSTGATTYSGDCLVKKWNGNAWVGVGVPLDENGFFPLGKILGIDAAGNLYSDASMDGTKNFIAKFQSVQLQSPKLLSFTPQSGSLGTKVTITGKNLTGTSLVKFGGTSASSISINNDSTITATVADGSTGSVLVETLAGSDSLETFTFTCDSIKGPVPYVTTFRDSFLVSTYANRYQWYFNNNKLENDTLNLVAITDAGFYHVETSNDDICWVPSLDYPVLISQNPLPDSLKLYVYPNPSSGKFTADVKLPRTTTAEAYVKVFDVNGVQILQTNKLIFYGNEIRIPVTISSKGTYFVKVFVNDDAVQQSIIIM